MRITWMGMTTGRVKMPRICWVCDCGREHFNTGSFNRTLYCADGCGRTFEVEIQALPDPQLGPAPRCTTTPQEGAPQ